MRIGWTAPAAPLPPVAALGDEHLAARVRPGHTVHRFRHCVVVLGDDLPWVDGVQYLGALADAPSVLVPVHRVPAAPSDIVAAAVRRLVGPRRAVLVPDDVGDTVAVLAL